MDEILNATIQHGTLNLSCEHIEDEGAKHICSIDTLSIRQLSLYRNSISSIGVAALTKAKWDNIEYLDLSDNMLANLGCKFLSRINFIKLKILQITYNQIQSAGIMHLSKAQWSNLQQILLGNPISVDGVKYLLKTNWSKLSLLQIYDCGLNYLCVLRLIMLHTKMAYIYLGKIVITAVSQIHTQQRIVKAQRLSLDEDFIYSEEGEILLKLMKEKMVDCKIQVWQ